MPWPAFAVQLEAWYTLTHPNGRRVYVSGTDRFDILWQVHIQTCYERWDAADAELMRPPWELTLRYVAPLDLEALLHYNGLEVLGRYGDGEGGPCTEETEGGPWCVCGKSK